MSEINNIQVAGRLKNVRVFTERGMMVTASLSQRNKKGEPQFTIPIITFDPNIAAALKSLGEHASESGVTDEVIITGQLDTYYSKNPDGSWKPPYTRVLVDNITVA